MLIDDATLEQLRQDSDVAWTALANAIRARWGGKTELAVGRSDTDDILQEVFLRIFSHLDRITDAGHLERFVAKVWRQRVFEWHRQRSKISLVALSSAPPDDHGHGRSSPDVPEAGERSDPRRRAISEELRRTLERTAPLSAEQRLIVALHVFEACTFAEIAGLLQQNVKTVETWYRRAVALVAQQLALDVYRHRPADFEAVLSDAQKQALQHLLRGLPLKKTAQVLRLRVPERAHLLAPAWEILGHAAQADWFRDL